MEQYQTFYIQKSSQAFDDTLVAFGLATIVQQLLDNQAGDNYITIIDKGQYYELSLKQPLKHDTVERYAVDVQPAPAIETDKNPIDEGIPKEIYEEHLAIADAYFKTRGQDNETEPPDKRLDIFKAINDYSKFNIRGSYNSLIELRHAVRHQPDVLFILLDLFANRVNDLDAAISRWQELSVQEGWDLHTKTKYEATLLQMFNPASGKGQNKPKADGISISNVSGFWLIEWLKAVGIYEAGVTKFFGGAGDQKTAVLAPRKLTFEQHQRILSKFRDAMLPATTSIKFDILIAIRYTTALLDYIVEAEDPLLELFGLGDIKQTLVNGFYTAYYKNMGGALATMNLSFVALPSWVNIQSPDDVHQIFKPILEMLEQVIRQFDESHSDDVMLLTHMRDFISGSELRSLLKFTTSYASFYMRKRERGFAIPLTTDFIERMILVMGNRFAELADRKKHAGFHNIAAAIAQVTIWAQHGKETTPYKIRYGLHRELARQAQTPEKFLRAINGFIHSYNAETMRAKELGKLYVGQMISPVDIDDMLSVMDMFDRDSQLVAEILLAYGSTFTRFVKSQQETE